MSFTFSLARRMAFVGGGRLSGIISMLSVAGIGVAVAALLIVLAVVNGFRSEFARSLLQAEPHIVIRSFGQLLMREDTVERNSISGIVGVVQAANFLSHEVLISHGRNVVGGVARGMDMRYGLFPGRRTVVSGVMPDSTRHEIELIALGTELSERLSCSVGDTIRLATFLSRGGRLYLRSPRVQRFTVAGIIDTGIYQYNNSICVLDLSVAQEFFRTEGSVTGIEIAVEDPFRVEETMEEISDSLGYPLYATSWTQSNAPMFAMLTLQKRALFLILTLMIIVAAANVVSGLTALVASKQREIGVLMAMGIPRVGIVRIFLGTGAILGFSGLIMGIGTALILIALTNEFHLVRLAADVYQVDNLPLRLEIVDIVLVTLAVFVISVCATVAPARRAGRLLPIQILRYE